MPVSLGHQCHDIVTTDAGIVDDDRDVFTLVCCLPASQGSTRLFAVADIEAHQGTLSATLFQRLLSLSVIAGIVYQYMVALLSQFYCDGPAYAATATCYQCVVHLFNFQFYYSTFYSLYESSKIRSSYYLFLNFPLS